jgi:methyl-accepting chemotaxis protein
VPIRDSGGSIAGVVITEREIDNSFVDGIKKATGLDSAVYGGLKRAATTLVAADGHSRWVGVSETNPAVKQTVLEKGQTYQGSLRILNQPYLAVYAPLKDANNTAIGMLFIGQQRINLLKTIAQSIELTFLVAILLIILLIFPAYLISRKMARQLG